MEDDHIKLIKKSTFKKMIKEKIVEAAFSELSSIIKTQSKVKEIRYDKFECQKYFKDPRFKHSDRLLLAMLRGRMNLAKVGKLDPR